MNLTPTVLVVLLTVIIQCGLAQQQCGGLQYLNTTTNECINITTSKSIVDNIQSVYFTK